MKLRSSLAALTVALFAAAPAFATDLGGSKGSTNYTPDESPVNWTGIYIGGQIGYGNANHELTVQRYDDEAVEDIAGLDGINSRGFIGGGTVGFDKQMGRFVAGVFGTYDFSNIKSGAYIADFADASIEKNDEWSVGARAGLLVNPRTLVYLLAAYSQTGYDFKGELADGGGSFAKNVTFDGVAVGGGIEVAMTPNVFLGLEYRHTFYDSETIFDTGVSDSVGAKLINDLDEDRVMMTLKMKLNADLGSNFGF